MTEILVQTGETLLKTSPAVETQTTSSFDFLHIMRILFYILVLVKLIQLSFLRRKKHSLKERVYRKFLFAHQELLKQFTQEDKTSMEQTLNNTIKNATIQFKSVRSKLPKNKKRVNFSVEKNSYYEPKQWKIDDDEDNYLDVEDIRGNLLFDSVKQGDVRDKMIEEEFGQRQNLEKINEKEEQIEIEVSKLTQQTQSSSIVGNNEPIQVSELPVQSKDSLLLIKDSLIINRDKAKRDDDVNNFATQMASKKEQ